MNGADAVAAIALFTIFAFGIMLGAIAITAWSINREDRRRSLKGTPPDHACAGTRRLVGVGRRDVGPGQELER